jgi:hypothetical protein
LPFVDYLKKIKVKKENGEEEEDEERHQEGELESSSLNQLISFSSCPSSPAPTNTVGITEESESVSSGKRKSPAKKVNHSYATFHLEKNQKNKSESDSNEGTPIQGKKVNNKISKNAHVFNNNGMIHESPQKVKHVLPNRISLYFYRVTKTKKGVKSMRIS